MTADATVLVVDAANVVGSRPDGWWRDRAGAARRLRDRLAAAAPALREAGVGEVVLVVEGAAREVEGVPGVRVVGASGSGDDALVEEVGRLVRQEGRGGHGGRLAVVRVVTADRGLRDRVAALGATVVGPSWLLGVAGQR